MSGHWRNSPGAESQILKKDSKEGSGRPLARSSGEEATEHWRGQGRKGQSSDLTPKRGHRQTQNRNVMVSEEKVLLEQEERFRAGIFLEDSVRIRHVICGTSRVLQ